jgi:hypothetical protein
VANLIAHSPEEMLGQPLLNFNPLPQREKLREIFWRHLKRRESFKILPYTLLDKAGDSYNFESYFITHFNDHGELRGFRIISWPIPN